MTKKRTKKEEVSPVKDTANSIIVDSIPVNPISDIEKVETSKLEVENTIVKSDPEIAVDPEISVSVKKKSKKSKNLFVNIIEQDKKADHSFKTGDKVEWNIDKNYIGMGVIRSKTKHFVKIRMFDNSLVSVSIKKLRLMFPLNFSKAC